MYCPTFQSFIIQDPSVCEVRDVEQVTIRRGRADDSNTMHWSGIYMVSPDDTLAHQAELAGMRLDVCVEEQPCTGSFERLVDYLVPIVNSLTGNQNHDLRATSGVLVDISLQVEGDAHRYIFCCEEAGPVWQKVQELLPLGQE